MKDGTRRLLTTYLAPPGARVSGLARGVLLVLTIGTTSSAAVQETSRWLQAVDGDWDDPTKWSTAAFPDNSLLPSDPRNYDVVIDAAGTPYTVDLHTSVSIDSLTVSSADVTLALDRFGDLSVLGPFELQAGTFSVRGGRISGGTISSTGGSMEVGGRDVEPTTFDGVTLDTDLILEDPARLHIENGLELGENRRIRFRGGRNLAMLTFAGDQTLSGGGQIVFEQPTGSLDYNYIHLEPGTTLTIGPNITICTDGADGRLGSATIGNGIINQGLISGRTVGRPLRIEGPTFNNQGVVEAVDGGWATLENDWINNGVFRVNNGGTLDLGGEFSHIGTLDYRGGKIRILGTFNNPGTWTIDNSTGSIELADGGTIVGGAVIGADGRTLVAKRGTLDDIFLGADVIIGHAGSSGGYLTVRNGLTLDNSTISLSSSDSLSSHAELLFDGTQALDGQGTIRFAAGRGNKIAASAGTLTIGPDIVIEKLSGSGQLGNDDTGLVNYGLIKAGTSGGMTITGRNWLNYGTIELGQGGTLGLAGVMRTSALGTIINDGGQIELRGTIDNRGEVFNLQGLGGPVLLAGGTIRGGTLGGTSPMELVVSTINGYLDGVTIDADLNTRVVGLLGITNGLTLNHRKITLHSGDSLTFLGAQTLGGTGELIVHSRPNSSGYTTSLSGPGLVIGPNVTIRTGNYTGGSHAIKIGGNGSVNQGTIVVDKAVVEIDGAGWTNQGVIEQSGGRLFLNGSFTTAAIGNLVHTGGDVTIDGVLTNTGDTLMLDASTGSWYLDGTIVGGTVATADGERLQIATDDHGRFEQVTLAGRMVIHRVGELSVAGGLVLDGAEIRMISGRDQYYWSEIHLPGAQTIGGHGDIVFDGPGDYNWIRLYNGSSLTIGKHVTVRTGTGGGTIGTAGLPCTNQGTISAQTAGKRIQITGEFANPGTLRASYATLTVDSPDWTSGGAIQLLQGTLQVDASLLTNDVRGRIEGIGTLEGSGTTFVTDGVVAPGLPFPIDNMTGRLTFDGDFHQTSHGLLSIDILHPTETSGFDSVTVTGTAQLAGKLEVCLLPEADFTYGDTLDLLRANSVAGQFDEVVLPTLPSGKPMFSLTYRPDTVTLTYVPEPTTLTLAAIGSILLLGFTWRRKQPAETVGRSLLRT